MRSLSLRWHLVLLVAGTLLPIVLFAVAIVYELSQEEQVASERRMLLAARTLATTVERELSSTTRTLEALAVSEQLHQGDLRSFHNEVTRLVKTQPSWLTVILLSSEGQQLVNSRRPFGAPLPSANDPDSVQQLIETRQPTIGNLARGQIGQALAFPVRVPVTHDGDLNYILTAAITPQALVEIINEPTPLDDEWTRTVVDGQGIIVAHTRDPERFVGQRGIPSFLKRIGETTEGIYQDTTLEGVEVYIAFCRVQDSTWTVAVTVPVETIQGTARRALGTTAGFGFGLLLVSGVGAFTLSRQISRSITSTAIAAEALAKGKHPKIDLLSIKEVVLLGQSLEFAASLLAQREQERAEHLTRAEAAREEAEAANRIKDEFLAVLSHELRTPLNPILGWSTMLRSGKLNATKTAFALETIERNAKLQTQLIEDLLDITRIIQGKLILTMTPVRLVPIIESAIETVRLAAAAKSIQIQTKLDVEIDTVLGDSIRLQQVIWNLLSNAVKFTSGGGQVNVQLLRRGTQAHIQVSDTGKGINPAFLPYVFEYFRQEDSTMTRKFGGLGLGLAIARHLVELHGGTIQANSPGEGQGSTFTIILPLFIER